MTLQDMYDSRVNRIPISRSYTKMAGIRISAKEIESLLRKLIPNKASEQNHHHSIKKTLNYKMICINEISLKDKF